MPLDYDIGGVIISPGDWFHYEAWNALQTKMFGSRAGVSITPYQSKYATTIGRTLDIANKHADVKCGQSCSADSELFAATQAERDKKNIITTMSEFAVLHGFLDRVTGYVYNAPVKNIIKGSGIYTIVAYLNGAEITTGFTVDYNTGVFTFTEEIPVYQPGTTDPNIVQADFFFLNTDVAYAYDNGVNALVNMGWNQFTKTTFKVLPLLNPSFELFATEFAWDIIAGTTVTQEAKTICSPLQTHDFHGGYALKITAPVAGGAVKGVTQTVTFDEAYTGKVTLIIQAYADNKAKIGLKPNNGSYTYSLITGLADTNDRWWTLMVTCQCTAATSIEVGLFCQDTQLDTGSAYFDMAALVQHPTNWSL